nr:MAG TPA: hypothetical protein [Caudoviricetes sp.]
MSTSSGPARPRFPPRPHSRPTIAQPTVTRPSTPTRDGSG